MHLFDRLHCHPEFKSGLSLIMIQCRVRLPLLVISSAAVLIFGGQGIAVSNEKRRSHHNNRRNDKLPSQEAPEAPLPLGHLRRPSRPRKLAKICLGKVFGATDCRT